VRFVLALLLFSMVCSIEARGPFSKVAHDSVPSLAGEANQKSYKWPAEEDDMILAHNAIRKEIRDMKHVLDGVKEIETWQIASIQAWWKGHEAHMRFHCKNEHGHLHPAMSERIINFPAEKMKQDHNGIYQHLGKISRLVSNLKAAEEPKDLSNAWEKYAVNIMTHFRAEEEEGVVSVRNAFSAKDWAPIIRTFFDQGAKEEFGSFIHAMGQDNFRNKFMKKRKIPGFVWNLGFKKNLSYYQKSMGKYMDALTSGIPP